jgi:hypothetical protein
MLFPAPPPPAPVSFSRDVAPILAMHCNGCHGDAGGLSTRSYRELMLGGNLGKLIIAGDPERSVLMQFLDGRRTGQQRMPRDGRPLTASQLNLIRRWISEGAANDTSPSKAYRLSRTGVPVSPTKITRVFCRVNTAAYLVLTLRDPGNGRVLWSDAASVKSPKDAVDAAEPGQMISWDIRAGQGWPEAIAIELSIDYAAVEPEAELYAKLLDH